MPPNRRKYFPNEVVSSTITYPSADEILNLPQLPPPVPIDLRNEFEKQYDKYISPANKFVNSLIQPVDPETGLPNVDLSGPVFSGAKGIINAADILEAIKKSGVTHPAEIAVEYFKHKYPKIASVPKRIESVGGNAIDILRGVLGGYEPSTNEIRIIKDRLFGNKTPTKEFVDTAGHEATHGLQYQIPKRREKLGIVDPHPETRRSQGMRYISSQPQLNLFQHLPEKQQNKIKDMAMEAYRQQWVEREARQGGETAKETFKKFSDLIREKPNLLDYEATPITAENRELAENMLGVKLADQLRIFKDDPTPTYREIAKDNYKKAMEYIDAQIKTGSRFGNNPNYNPNYFPQTNITFGDIMSFGGEKSYKDLLKGYGYTGISSKYLDKPFDFRPDLDEILNDPLYYEQALYRLRNPDK